jgi:hypothetical protein
MADTPLFPAQAETLPSEAPTPPAPREPVMDRPAGGPDLQAPADPFSLRTSAAQNAEPMLPADYHPPVDHGFSFGDTAAAIGASVAINTTLGSLATFGHIPSLTDARPENWNPYTYIETNFGPETRKEMELPIRQGIFEDANTPAEVERIAKNYLTEKELRGMMAQSPTGNLIGGMMDPINYVGWGWAAKGAGLLSTAGRMAIVGGVSSAAQQGVLYNLQDMRTLSESLVNVGESTLFAGGAGALFGSLAKGAGALAPTVARGLDAVSARLDAAIAKGPEAVEALSKEFDSTVGAMSVPPTDVNLLSTAPAKLGGVSWLDRGMALSDIGTPLLKGMQWTTNSARNVLLRIADSSGMVLQDGEGKLMATPMSAETLARTHMANWYYAPSAAIDSAANKLSQELAKMGAPKLDQAGFWDVIQRHLTNRVGDETEQALISKYGAAGANKVLGTAKAAAATIRTVNSVVEKHLIEVGELRDVPRLEQIEKTRTAEMEAHKAATDKLQQAISMANATSTRGTEAAPEAAAALAERRQQLADLRAAHAERMKPLDQARNEQLSKPEPMGDKYGHAQIWNKSALIQNHADIKAILQEKFAGEPMEFWLREQHDINLSQYKALAESDLERYSAITKQWGGDEWYARIALKEQQLAGASARADAAEADLRRTSYYAERAAENHGKDARIVARAERDRLINEAKLAEAERTDEGSRRAGVLRARASEIEEAIGHFESEHEFHRMAKASLDDSVREANRVNNLSARNVRELKSQLAALNGKPAAADVAEQVMQTLTGNGHLPLVTADMDGALSKSGRMMPRTIHLTPDETEKLTKLGALDNNLPRVLKNQMQSLAGHLAMREAFGIRPGARYESWKDVMSAIDTEYREKMEGAVSAKEKAAVEAELKQAQNIIALTKDRVVGADLSGVADKDSITYWGGNLLKRLNLARYASGFGVGSLAHMPALILDHKIGDITRVMSGRMWQAMSAGDKSLFETLIHAVDAAQHGTPILGAQAPEAMADAAGVGVAGTMKHAVTSGIDQVLDKGVNIGSRLSFLPNMLRTVRIAASMDTLNRMTRVMNKGWDKLSVNEMTHFATLGIDRAKLERIDEMFGKHGSWSDNGFFSPNVDQWGTDLNSREALRDLQAALSRDMSKASPTRGVADLPRFMSTQLGSLATQFMGYPFAAYNRFISPALQRLVHQGDWRALGALTASLAGANLTFMARDALEGKNPLDRYTPAAMPSTMVSMVDRVGAMGWASPAIDGIMKLASVDGKGGMAGKYRNNQGFESLLGPNFALLKQLNDVAVDTAGVAHGATKPDKLAKDVIRVSPFSMYARMFLHLLPDH